MLHTEYGVQYIHWAFLWMILIGKVCITTYICTKNTCMARLRGKQVCTLTSGLSYCGYIGSAQTSSAPITIDLAQLKR